MCMKDQKQFAMEEALSAWKKLKEIHLADIRTGIASSDWIVANCAWLDARDSLIFTFCMSEDLVMADFAASKTPEILDLEEEIALRCEARKRGGSVVFFC